MNHPKMAYTYVGIDSHKDTHTAVFLNCFFEKLGELVFDNLPSKFDRFLKDSIKFQQPDTTLLFGLEDVSMYGRNLAVFFKKNNQKFKHVNALLVAKERKNQTVTQKTDSVDAECAARILISKFEELPDAQPDDRYWMLKALVMRRDFIVKNNIALKNHLQSILTQHYPNYRSFFAYPDSNTALAFFERFPSPSALKGVSLEELTQFFLDCNGRSCSKRAKKILETLQDTAAEFQEIRDEAVRSTVRQIRFNLTEIKRIEIDLVRVFEWFDTTLTSMNGLGPVSAAQMLSHIGDIGRFATPAKLARYAGVAPVTYASGKKDKQFANHRGNRDLNSIFYLLAVRVIARTPDLKNMQNPFFCEYYHKKLSEGKTKVQALKCVQRRLVNIVWHMLTYHTKYENPEMRPADENMIKA